jgi:hypothetical protein
MDKTCVLNASCYHILVCTYQMIVWCAAVSVVNKLIMQVAAVSVTRSIFDSRNYIGKLVPSNSQVEGLKDRVLCCSSREACIYQSTFTTLPRTNLFLFFFFPFRFHLGTRDDAGYSRAQSANKRKEQAWWSDEFWI